jgi:hypothetical protein
MLILLKPHAPNNYGMWFLIPTLLDKFNVGESNKSKGGLYGIETLTQENEMGLPLDPPLTPSLVES